MHVLPIEQANERRLIKAIRAYLDGESKCTLKWIRGTIGIDAPLANVLLMKRFSEYATSEKYRNLCASPLKMSVEFSCYCDSTYQLELETVLGASLGFISFECVKCGRRHQTEGYVSSALLRNEYSGQWEAVPNGLK